MSQSNESSSQHNGPPKYGPVRIKHVTGQPMITTPVKTKNILLVGLTGSGKTSLVSGLANNDGKVDNQDVRSGPRAVTKNIHKYASLQVTHDSTDYVLNFYDTRGIADPDKNIDQIKQEWEEFVTTELAQLDVVVLVFRPDRLRRGIPDEIHSIFQFFKHAGATSDNFVVVLSHCEWRNDETIDDYWEQISTDPDMKDVFSFCKSYAPVGFPKVSDYDVENHPELTSLCRASVQQSRELFISAIIHPSTPLNLRTMVVGDIIERMTQASLDQLDEAKANIDQVEEKSRSLVNEIIELESKLQDHSKQSDENNMKMRQEFQRAVDESNRASAEMNRRQGVEEFARQLQEKIRQQQNAINSIETANSSSNCVLM